MKYLEYKVSNMAISKAATDKASLISGAVNYFGLHFEFDEEFAGIPGVKSVEFYKNRNTTRIDLVDNACAIPNELLIDKQSFEIRVISGSTIGTQWVPIAIAESGIIMPEEPAEEAPENMEYVKTFSGDEAAPILRVSTSGLEYSQDGREWKSGVSGVPEVPSKPQGAVFGRANGDWVRIDKLIEEFRSGIREVEVNGIVAVPDDGKINIEIQGLQGEPGAVSELSYGTTDVSDVVAAFNGLVVALKARGVVA